MLQYELNDFEKRFIIDVLNQYRKELRLLGVKEFGKIETIVAAKFVCPQLT